MTTTNTNANTKAKNEAVNEAAAAAAAAMGAAMGAAAQAQKIERTFLGAKLSTIGKFLGLAGIAGAAGYVTYKQGYKRGASIHNAPASVSVAAE